jgi:hypothetical protein
MPTRMTRKRVGFPKPPQMVSQGVAVRFAKRGLGYERSQWGREVRLRQTEPPNALPASWRCPGQLKDVVWGACFIPARPDRLRSGLRPFRDVGRWDSPMKLGRQLLSADAVIDVVGDIYDINDTSHSRSGSLLLASAWFVSSGHCCCHH